MFSGNSTPRFKPRRRAIYPFIKDQIPGLFLFSAIRKRVQKGKYLKRVKARNKSDEFVIGKLFRFKGEIHGF